MGNIKTKISEDIKAAMKAQEKDRLSVLRMLLSELKYAASAENVHADMSDEAELKVVASYHKKLSKSRDEYPDEENKKKLTAEMSFVENYMPKRASSEEITKTIQEILESSPDRNFGNVMRAVMAKLGSGAEGKLVSELLKKSLS